MGGGSSKKRRKTATGEVAAPVRAAPARRAPVRAEVHVDDDAMDDSGNSRCTSEGDCIGSEQDGLIQHILNGEAGDLYCEKCWESFTRRNPQLEGVPAE